MDLVVTGATSFLGRALVKRLLEEGCRVWAVVRPGSGNREAFEREAACGMRNAAESADGPGSVGCVKSAGGAERAEVRPRRAELHIVELEMERFDRLPELIGRPCQVFFHFGWDGSGSENRKKAAIQQKNAEDSLKALQAARKLGCRRFIFSGSQAEYGLCRTLMTEDVPCVPISEYGKAKADFGRRASEQVRRWRQEGVEAPEYIHARIFSVYGPGDHEWSLVNTCLRTFRVGGCMELGDCTQLWNYLYIDDLTEGLLALAFGAACPGGVYNLAGDRDATRPLREYVEEMHRLCGGRGSLAYGRIPPNAEGQAQLMPDITKITGTTGWRPKVGFAEGIRRMLRETDRT